MIEMVHIVAKAQGDNIIIILDLGGKKCLNVRIKFIMHLNCAENNLLITCT